MTLHANRIRTTHTGSLPRGEALGALLIDEEQGRPIDRDALVRLTEERVAHVLKKQREVGLDIINDGEQGRVGFQTYLPQRMTGFGGASKRPYGKEFIEFPQFTERMMQRIPKTSKVFDAPQAVDDIQYTSTDAVDAEIDRLKRLSAELPSRDFELFMNAPSPGIVACTMLNAYYDSQEAYLDAAARQLRTEYQRVVEAGLLLQIDAPDLAMDRTMMFRDLSDAEFVKACERGVAAINAGIEGIPRERVRLHICYGNWEGPHIHDIALGKILPALYEAKVGALSIEFSNPRHAHEYPALKKHPLPKDMILIPGVVETTSNFVEHPEVVARRIEEAVAAVGDRERVVASTDCGFGTFTKREWVIEPVVWLKLKSIREGADIASSRLWGKKVA
jgi:5-methyltetrahydropteroyltriglutamate--homocysteine methyltransferase